MAIAIIAAVYVIVLVLRTPVKTASVKEGEVSVATITNQMPGIKMSNVVTTHVTVKINGKDTLMKLPIEMKDVDRVNVLPDGQVCIYRNEDKRKLRKVGQTVNATDYRNSKEGESFWLSIPLELMESDFIMSNKSGKVTITKY